MHKLKLKYCLLYTSSSTNSFKYSGTPKEKVYYHLTCKNPNCKSKGIHYSSDKIEQKLVRILNELTRYMYDMDNDCLLYTSSLTIYVIAMAIVVGVIAIISTFFYSNMEDTDNIVSPMTEYTKFNSFFSDEINHEGIEVVSCGTTDNGQN